MDPLGEFGHGFGKEILHLTRCAASTAAGTAGAGTHD